VPSNGSGILKWWVDAGFVVHPNNIQGHSGGGLFMGRGFPIVSSTKQKLNTHISTKSETCMGANDFMPAICWPWYFIEAQGYQGFDNVLFQDKSASFLEKNGKASSSKCMKHINIWYFVTTDRANNGDISLVWCPT
jgi:hypothetical protein